MPNFQIFIVSAVKICKQSLQTASASGRRPPKLPGSPGGIQARSPGRESLLGHRAWIPPGDPWVTAPPMKIHVAVTAGDERRNIYGKAWVGVGGAVSLPVESHFGMIYCVTLSVTGRRECPNERERGTVSFPSVITGMKI